MEDIKHVVAIEVEKQVQERLALQRSEFEARILQEKNELEKAKNDLKQATEATVNDQKARRNEHGENLDISEPITKKPRITASRLDTLIGMNPCPIGTPFDIHKDSVLRFYNTVKQGCREEMRTDEDSKEKNTSRASPVGQSVAPAAVGKQSLFNCKESWNSVANQHAMKVSMQRLKEKYVTFKMDDDFIKEQLKTTHKGKWDNYRKVQKVTVARDTEIAMTIGDQSAREEKKNTLQVVANTAQKNVSQRSRHAAACRRKATNRRAAAAKAHEMHAKICGMSMKDPANLSLIDNALIPGAMSSDDSEQDVDGKTIGYKRTILVARSDELTKCIEALDVIYEDMLKEKKKDKSAVRLTRRRTDDPRKSERKIKSKRGHHPWILKTKPDPYIAPPQLAQFSAIASAH
ncbi:hypothetical protein Q9L58_010508 [Maublancomyces gigas]|uniref:Uncharacterized protein n=1 Tax=Discina gigas TaxID=1032678 RepID=A0ABR3G4H7_9PEZI